MLPCPCGKCFACRLNRRKLWAHRIELEAMKHGDTCFVTLTYDEAHVPKDGSLKKEHMSVWLKSLRHAVSPAKVRYFFVGEYGDQTWRPHYHAVIFGLNHIVGGGVDGREGIVKKTWGKGHTLCAPFSAGAANYVAGYVTKKMTSKEDERLNGKEPEFARMSLRPGLGRSAMEDVAKALSASAGFDTLVVAGDVPTSLMHGVRRRSLGRYLRGKLRLDLGFASEKAPDGSMEKYYETLRDMLEDEKVKPENKKKSWSEIVVDLNTQKCRNLQARHLVFESHRKL